jgi:hypothetical protein
VTWVVGVPASKAVVMLHVFLAPLCVASSLDGTQDRGQRAGGRGWGPVPHEEHTSSAFDPVLGPWEKVKGVATEVGNDENQTHVGVRDSH